MQRALYLSIAVAALLNATKPTEFSTDMTMIEGGKVRQVIKLYVSGQKTRVEGMTLGQYGRVITIARKDKGLTWMLLIDKNQYSEQALDTSKQVSQFDPSNFDLANMKKEILGRETVLGYACTKMRIQAGTLPNGKPLFSTVWVADGLEIGVRMEAMGMVQENRNLRIRPQPASLFEIPAGYTRTTLFGGPSGGGMPRPPYGGKNAPAAGRVAPPAPPATIPAGPAWKVGVNRDGGDYRSVDMSTSDPAACKVICDREARCKSWTFVKGDESGGWAVCWLKNVVPPESPHHLCISGVKSPAAGGGGGTYTTSGSSPAWKENTDRGGSDYRTVEFVTSSPAPCKAACDSEARCKAWTFVKPDEPGGTGVCWLKEEVPEESYNPSCISGVKGAVASGGGGSAWKDNTDRGGSDYRSLEMATTNPGDCRALCDSEEQCKAWTFVKPDTAGGNAACWLKEEVPPESHDPRCVSGVKTR